MQVNAINLTAEQQNQAREIITKSIDNRRIYHPEKLDFTHLVIEKVVTLANQWLPILAKHKDDYKATLPALKITKTEKSIVQQIFENIFKIKIVFDYASEPQAPKCTVIPNGLHWQYPLSDQETSEYRVTCTWFLGNNFVGKEAQKPAAIPTALVTSAYREELANLRNLPFDCILKVIKDGAQIELPAHRFKLACHSQMFFTLFDSATYKEATSGEFSIPDHTYESVKTMLDFIYTGELDPKSSAQHLLAVTQLAHQYQIRSLVIACEQHLSERLHTEFEKIYEVASLLKLDNLLPFCLEYIAREGDKLIPLFINSINTDNFAILYQTAHNLSLAPLVHELEMWKKYNVQGKTLEISVETTIEPAKD